MSKRTSEGHATNEAVSNQLRNMAHDSPSAFEVRALIARRAYELYNQRGAEFGDELSDWLKAEGEVVTMLLAEPQETCVTEVPPRTSDSPRIAESADAAHRRVTRRPKRNSTLNGNPA